MTRRFSRAIHSVVHTCSAFGSYMMHLQSRCLRHGANGGCEGGPTADEARRDYQIMLDSTKWQVSNLSTY